MLVPFHFFPRTIRAFQVLSLAGVIFFLDACGGGGSGNSQPTQPTQPTQPVSVIISNAPAGVNAGTTYQFTAHVLNSTDQSVTWTVTCVVNPSCDPNTVGTIGTNGVFTAPSTVTQSLGLAVIATSVADRHQSDQRQFTLMPAIAISMTPTTAQVVLGFPYDFAASVSNDLDNHGVKWAVNGTVGGNAQVGTISAQGRYEAPNSGAAVTITAISVSDKNKTATATITLISNPHPDFTGKYTLSFSGPDGFSITAAAGTLNLDGAGNVSATVDIVSGGANAFLPGLAMTGIYGFEDNNVGTGKLTYTTGQQAISIPFRFVLLSNSVARMVEFDGSGTGVGTIEKQADSGLAMSLDGNRVLSLTGLSRTSGNNMTIALLGAFSGSNGNLSGIFDTAGYDQTAFTGTYSLGNANTLSLNFGQWNASQVMNFRVYPVSADKAFVMSVIDVASRPVILSGVIEKQTGGPFSVASFAGNWVFSLQYSDPNFYLTKSVLARVSSDGSGTDVVRGYMDHNGMTVWDGPAYPISFSRYHVADNGRGNANAQFAMPEPLVWYWVTPQRGYIMCDNPYDVGIGEFFLQQNTAFNTASLNRSFSVMLPGYWDVWTNASPDFHLGTASADGAGNFTLITSDVDGSDPVNPLKVGVTRSGTYSFDNDGNGRGLINLDSGDFVLRFYSVSATKLLLMRPAYDVINAGTAETPVFASDSIH